MLELTVIIEIGSILDIKAPNEGFTRTIHVRVPVGFEEEDDVGDSTVLQNLLHGTNLTKNFAQNWRASSIRIKGVEAGPKRVL
jgi:hypothetical protein